MKSFLEDLETAKPWLTRAGFRDPVAAHKNFVAIAQQGIPLDLLAELQAEIVQYLPASADADMALNNFERMLAKTRSPLSMVTFLLRKRHSLAVLIQLFSTSQYFSELLIGSPEYFDFLWENGHTPLDPKLLKDEILSEIRSVGDNDEHILALIRRHRQREMLRIGYRDIVLGEPLDRITASISDLADSLVEVSLAVAYRKMGAKYGEPRSDGRLSRLVVLAMGKLGGRELNYSSDIDLVLIYDKDGKTDRGEGIGNAEFFAEVIREMVRLLSFNTPKGTAYRVDLRLRPHGDSAALCMSLERTIAYYDRHGRTWERQALVKVRPIAGSMMLGEDFLRAIKPFVYRRYLNYVEINEIKAIKRKIESKTKNAGKESTDLKTGHGGIRDIEFVVQFLQLVNGGVLPEVRERNTLQALRRLASAGVIKQEELTALETAYRFLRKAEHRLQFMFDLQTHRIPTDPDELDKLALRMGYLSGDSIRPGEQFMADLRFVTERNRNMLNRLMLDLFPNDQHGLGEPETDLILDPNPEPARVREVLGRYPFSDIDAAYKNLCLLAKEQVPFLSSIRCRHFLASIAPRLLKAVAEAPDPDMALVNLEKVTDSIGAKGALWESFANKPALLRLYVNLCSWSQYLSEILINNPGMIDELLDTLVMNRPPPLADLRTDLQDLLRGAREIDPILHSFKNTRLLGIGVLDVLGKQSLQQTTRQLSELAESIIGAIADLHYEALIKEHGEPRREDDPDVVSQYGILGIGKFGGSELSYHSDLDLILVYQADGNTSGNGFWHDNNATSNHHFYTKLTQKIIQTASRMGPLGRLYPIDLRLRPTGRSGSLVIPLHKFEEYYRDNGGAALWERQAMTRARYFHGDSKFGEEVEAAIVRAVQLGFWTPQLVDQIEDMRKRLEVSRGANDLKRGPGGIVDVEFAVQLLQLKRSAVHPEILQPNLWIALQKIQQAGLWDAETVRIFYDGYTFLRTVESRLRIVHNVCRDDLPQKEDELERLAYRMGYEGDNAAEEFLADFRRHTTKIRDRFTSVLRLERTPD